MMLLATAEPPLPQVYKFNVPTFGPGVIYDVDVSVRIEQVRFFAESLKTEKLKSYVPLFVSEAEVQLCSPTCAAAFDRHAALQCMLRCAINMAAETVPSTWQQDMNGITRDSRDSFMPRVLLLLLQAFFAKWDDEGIVDLNSELAELIILTASRTLMGELLPPRLSNSQPRCNTAMLLTCSRTAAKTRITCRVLL